MKTAKKNPKKLTADQWQKIAAELYQRVKFALQRFSKQSGSVMTENKESGEMDLQHWREYFADGMDLWPGVKVDRELMHALGLPRKQRDKRVKEIEAERAKQKETTTP